MSFREPVKNTQTSFPSLKEILEDELIQDELKLLHSSFMGADDYEVNCDDWECRLADRMYVLMGSPFDDESEVQ